MCVFRTVKVNCFIGLSKKVDKKITKTDNKWLEIIVLCQKKLFYDIYLLGRMLESEGRTEEILR